MTGPIGGNREQQIQAWAKAKFASLDAADGKDGKIQRDTWNNFVGSIGTGKTINIFINEGDAMRSLCTYASRSDSGVINNNDNLKNELDAFVNSGILVEGSESAGNDGRAVQDPGANKPPIEARVASENLRKNIDSFNIMPEGMDSRAQLDLNAVKNNIQGAYGAHSALNGAGSPPSEAEQAVSLLIEAMQNAGTDMDDGQRLVFAIKNIAAKYPNETICGKTSSEIAKMNNLQILQTFSADGHKPFGVIGTEIEDPANDPRPNVRAIYKNVTKAQGFLKEQLPKLIADKTISDQQFVEQYGMSRAKCQRILQYLDTIRYEDDELHDTMHGSVAGVWVNSKLNPEETASLESMVCMLLHEANHCDEAYLRSFAGDSDMGDLRHRDENNVPRRSPMTNTLQEELQCETIGVLTTAHLIQQGVLKDKTYGRYSGPQTGPVPENVLMTPEVKMFIPQAVLSSKMQEKHPFLDYLKNPNGREMLREDLNGWASGGYTNYIEDYEGTITLKACAIDRHYNTQEAYNNRNKTEINVTKGCTVEVAGRDPITIGYGTYIQGCDSAEIFQVDGIEGLVIFEDLKPEQSVLEGVGKGNLINTGKKVVLTDAFGKKHEGFVYKEGPKPEQKPAV